jgi:hypothetical protein
VSKEVLRDAVLEARQSNRAQRPEYRVQRTPARAPCAEKAATELGMVSNEEEMVRVYGGSK